jgi:predicted nucleic-acid-binding Zn-ribbon protein
MFDKRSSATSTPTKQQQLRKSKSLTTTGTSAKNIIDMTLKRRSTGCINRRSSSIYSTTSTNTTSLANKVSLLLKKIFFFLPFSLTPKLTFNPKGNLASTWIL